MMKKTLSSLVLATMVGLPALAAPPTPDDLIKGWQKNQQTGFTGNRVQDLTRGDLHLHLTGKVTFHDPGNFQIKITKPAGMASMELALRDNKSQFFFPV